MSTDPLFVQAGNKPHRRRQGPLSETVGGDYLDPTDPVIMTWLPQEVPLDMRHRVRNRLESVMVGPLVVTDIPEMYPGTAIITSQGFATAIVGVESPLNILDESQEDITDEGGEPLFMG